MSDDDKTIDFQDNVLPFRTVVRSLSESRKANEIDPAKNTPPIRYGPGRMTGYLPKFCDEVIDLGREGKSIAYIIGALGVSRSMFSRWREAFPEFEEAVQLSQLYSQQWWEDIGQTGMLTKGIDSGIWSKNMAARFKDEWQDLRRVEATGKDGGAIKVENRLDIVNQILNNLKVLEHDDKD